MIAGLLGVMLPAVVWGQTEGLTGPGGKPGAVQCSMCAGWTVPHAPVRLFGNTWYVGMKTLSALLVTSPQGHVLLDGGLPANAPQILASIRAAGFDPRDVKVIVNSHAHYDHAGGIAALQRATGARVLALDWSAAVLRRGATRDDDPQAAVHFDFPAVQRVQVIADGDTVRVGPLRLVAHRTGGHTPGGTTWTWQSCEGARCVEVVYADSQSPISADGFHYAGSTAIAQFVEGHARLESMRCDLLVTPHPEATRLWERVAQRDAGDASTLLDASACRRYAGTARAALEARLEREATPARQEIRTAAPTDPSAFERLWRARQDSLKLKVNAADVQFMNGMIQHHAQAVTMSTMAPLNGANESVQRLAARIINAQRDEIAIMRRWLGERKQPVPELHDMVGTLMVHMPSAAMDHGAGHDGHAAMAGMLTEAELAALRAAKGTEFDRLFLAGMIRHHRGAVTMVDQLFATDGAALDGQVFKFASDVQVDQRTEVQRMESMLVALGLFRPQEAAGKN